MKERGEPGAKAGNFITDVWVISNCADGDCAIGAGNFPDSVWKIDDRSVREDSFDPGGDFAITDCNFFEPVDFPDAVWKIDARSW